MYIGLIVILQTVLMCTVAAVLLLDLFKNKIVCYIFLTLIKLYIII